MPHRRNGKEESATQKWAKKAKVSKKKTLTGQAGKAESTIRGHKSRLEAAMKAAGA